ncbi:MAG: cellulase family glycosylhydrolase [Oscillospiraceae bacterium]|nr:cellulase family glycosylhydrolase [Oscillospiraceae bacterium]
MKKGITALILALLLILPARAAAAPDVEPGAWYEAAVTEMYESRVLTGYEDGTFRPHRTIAASEYIAVVARQAGLTAAAVDSSHWAAGLLEAARQRGWYDWDELPPTGESFDKPISRQLAVKVMMNAFYPNAGYDFSAESRKLADFAALDGRYYNAVLGAYAVGLIRGDDRGNFNPKSGLTRAEACVMLHRAKQGSAVPDETPSVPTAVDTVSGGVSENGWLQVKGAQLCNAAGEPVVLRGMSSHGLHWFPQYANAQSIQNTAAFGANLFRVAMYTGEGGYLSQSAAVKKQLIAAVDAAIAADLYVIIDWHILSDGNPSAHTGEAAAFFREMAARYGDNPAVLYEICNEPNGGVSWSRDVKPYAETVIAAIRENAPKSVVLVGSPTWSQDIHEAAKDPLEGDNLMYTLHFYAGTHGAELRRRVDDVRAKGLAVFVSEWGTSRADGNGGVFLKESAEWLDFLDARGISWANWSLCDENETSAALKPGTPNNRAWTENDLSESGKFVVSRLSNGR